MGETAGQLWIEGNRAGLRAAEHRYSKQPSCRVSETRKAGELGDEHANQVPELTVQDEKLLSLIDPSLGSRCNS